MEAEARYTYVGAAVLVLLLALVASVVWLKDVGRRGEFKQYAIYFEEQALDGLQVGGDVNLRGIKVGRVQDYALSGDKLNRVRVQIRVDRRAPVRTNTVAVVSRNFVTGIAAITLINHEPAGPELTEVPDSDQLPVIAEGHSNLDEIAGRVNQVGELAANALTNVNLLLTADNRRDVMDTVRSLRDLASGLSQRLTAMDRALDRAGAAASSIAIAADRLGKAGDRVAAVAERSGERLDSALATGEQTLVDARVAFGRVANAADSLDRQAGQASRRLEDTASRVGDDLSAASSDLRASLDTATRVLDRLSDPRAALLGPGREQLGPGERKP